MKQKIGKFIQSIVYGLFTSIGHRYTHWVLPRIELYLGFRFSFSQFGEDLMIASVLHDIPNGIYVDVGCNRPVFFNNTYRLYLRGWSGLNIDGNRALIKRYSKVRPRDISVCEVISSDTTPTNFFVSESGLQSSLSKEFTGNERIQETQRVVPKTLTDVLDTHGFRNKKITLLCIDVEGYDLEVLDSLNFSRYRPHLICIEDFEFKIDKQNSLISQSLMQKGYLFIGYCNPSVIFVDGKTKKQHP